MGPLSLCEGTVVQTQRSRQIGGTCQTPVILFNDIARSLDHDFNNHTLTHAALAAFRWSDRPWVDRKTSGIHPRIHKLATTVACNDGIHTTLRYVYCAINPSPFATTVCEVYHTPTPPSGVLCSAVVGILYYHNIKDIAIHLGVWFFLSHNQTTVERRSNRHRLLPAFRVEITRDSHRLSSRGKAHGTRYGCPYNSFA